MSTFKVKIERLAVFKGKREIEIGNFKVKIMRLAAFKVKRGRLAAFKV